MEETHGKLSKSDQAYGRFKLVFHSIILIFALCLFVSSIVGFDEMERAPLYLTLAIVFNIQSVYELYKIKKQGQ